MQITLHLLPDNSPSLPPLQGDQEEFQIQTEDNLRERYKQKAVRRE